MSESNEEVCSTPAQRQIIQDFVGHHRQIQDIPEEHEVKVSRKDTSRNHAERVLTRGSTITVES